MNTYIKQSSSFKILKKTDIFFDTKTIHIPIFYMFKSIDIIFLFMLFTPRKDILLRI